MILSDTPGIIKPAYEMQASMMNFVKSAFEDADILIYMVEIGEQDLKDEAFFNKIIHAKIPVLLLLNKIDNSNQEQLMEQRLFGLLKCLMPKFSQYQPYKILAMCQRFLDESLNCCLRVSCVLFKRSIDRQTGTFLCE